MPINVTNPVIVAKKRDESTENDLASIRNKAGTPAVVTSQLLTEVPEDNFEIVSKSSAFLRDMLAEKK